MPNESLPIFLSNDTSMEYIFHFFLNLSFFFFLRRVVPDKEKGSYSNNIPWGGQYFSGLITYWQWWSSDLSTYLNTSPRTWYHADGLAPRPRRPLQSNSHILLYQLIDRIWSSHKTFLVSGTVLLGFCFCIYLFIYGERGLNDLCAL